MLLYFLYNKIIRILEAGVFRGAFGTNPLLFWKVMISNFFGGVSKLYLKRLRIARYISAIFLISQIKSDF